MNNYEPSGPSSSPIGTGQQLRNHLTQSLATHDSQKAPITEFDVLMAGKLAERIDHGVTPAEYALETLLLSADCIVTSAHEYGDIEEDPQVTQLGFFALQAIDFAQGAFGEAYANQVRTTLQVVMTSSRPR